MARQQMQVIIKSVFKSGENTITKSQFTKKWIQLANQIEAEKRVGGSEHK